MGNGDYCRVVPRRPFFDSHSAALDLAASWSEYMIWKKGSVKEASLLLLSWWQQAEGINGKMIAKWLHNRFKPDIAKGFADRSKEFMVSCNSDENGRIMV
jgi:hypothetical protein